MSEAWEALRAAEEQRHSEAPDRHPEEAASAVLKSQNESKTHQCTEPIEILSVNHQKRQRRVIRVQIQAGSGSVHNGAAERASVRVAVQTQKADAACSFFCEANRPSSKSFILL